MTGGRNRKDPRTHTRRQDAGEQDEATRRAGGPGAPCQLISWHGACHPKVTRDPLGTRLEHHPACEEPGWPIRVQGVQPGDLRLVHPAVRQVERREVPWGDCCRPTVRRRKGGGSVVEHRCGRGPLVVPDLRPGKLAVVGPDWRWEP